MTFWLGDTAEQPLDLNQLSLKNDDKLEMVWHTFCRIEGGYAN